METTVDTLKKGDTLLVSVKAVKGGKTQLEFAEHIKNPNAKSSNSLVGLFNKSDEKFSSNKPRRGWITGEKTDMEEALGIKIPAMELGEKKDLNILNPQLGGESIRVQITETTDADNYQKDNIDSQAKTAGPEGDFIFCGGKHIFSNTSVVQGTATHTFLVADSNDESGEAEGVFSAPEELTA